jgi:hypothetical protein
LPHADDIEAYVLKAVGNNFCWRIWGQVRDYCFYKLLEIWGEGKIVEIIFLQVGFHGGIARYFFCNDTSSFSSISEFVLSFVVVF